MVILYLLTSIRVHICIVERILQFWYFKCTKSVREFLTCCRLIAVMPLVSYFGAIYSFLPKVPLTASGKVPNGIFQLATGK